MNVFKGNEQITTMYPERRLYKASSQPQTIPRIYATYAQDLFLVKRPVRGLRRHGTRRPAVPSSRRT